MTLHDLAAFVAALEPMVSLTCSVGTAALAIYLTGSPAGGAA